MRPDAPGRSRRACRTGRGAGIALRGQLRAGGSHHGHTSFGPTYHGHAYYGYTYCPMVLPTSANSVQAAIWVQLRRNPGPKPNQAAIWVQPVIAALVCLGRDDESGAVS